VKNLVLSVIDSETGTVLGGRNTYAVLSTEEEADKAGESDSAAKDLARKLGFRLRPSLLHALWATEKPTEDIVAWILKPKRKRRAGGTK
jgi:hypothetical protein